MKVNHSAEIVIGDGETASPTATIVYAERLAQLGRRVFAITSVNRPSSRPNERLMEQEFSNQTNGKSKLVIMADYEAEASIATEHNPDRAYRIAAYWKEYGIVSRVDSISRLFIITNCDSDIDSAFTALEASVGTAELLVLGQTAE